VKLTKDKDKDGDGSGHRELRNVIRITPHINWPTLGDDDQKVDRFVHKLENTIGLANDGRGMAPAEKLITLGHCLRQSRLMVYELLIERNQRSGKLQTEPQKVYSEIIARLMEFSEGMFERQGRVQREFSNLQKGNLKGLQFQPLFEAAVDELDMVSLGKSPRELLLAYLEKIGPKYRNDILKDKRIWGSSCDARAVDTWREAHRILIEVEALEEGGRSFHAAIGAHQDQAWSSSNGGTATKTRAQERARPQEQWDGSLMASTTGQPGDAPGVCYRKRDTGTCDRPNCPYNHSAKVVAAAKAKKEAKGRSKGGDGQSKQNPVGYQAAWNDAAPGGNGARNRSLSRGKARKGHRGKGDARGRSSTPTAGTAGPGSSWDAAKGRRKRSG